jgi:serine/threonine protein kinase
VEIFCKELARLLPMEQVGALRDRWQRENPDSAADAGQFCQWLVSRRTITEYQAGVLSRGHADRLFIGRYKVIERIGKGRMAGVYKAEDERGKPVAIKILPPSKAKDLEILARFQRESRLALQLQHPNLARTLHAGEEHGLHIIVMEYLKGDLLADVLRRQKRLEPRDAARVVYQALLGLQCLHEQAMVHRDLEPGNIMLLPSRDQGKKAGYARARVKILDLGLGLGLFEEDDNEGRQFQLTGEGAMLGVPEYMSPEQARDAHNVTIRADIYSLGCVLYHALTGQPPFPDTNRVRQLVRHATETPLPLKTLNPSIPHLLQPIIDRMLAKNPADRFASPQAAAQALRAFLLTKEILIRAKKGTEGKPRTKGASVAVETTGDVSLVAAPVQLVPQTPVVAPLVPQPTAGPIYQALPVSPDADVELVTPNDGVQSPAWSRRDWLIFAGGATAGVGTIIAAVGLGWLVSRFLKKTAAE